MISFQQCYSLNPKKNDELQQQIELLQNELLNERLNTKDAFGVDKKREFETKIYHLERELFIAERTNGKLKKNMEKAVEFMEKINEKLGVVRGERNELRVERNKLRSYGSP